MNVCNGQAVVIVVAVVAAYGILLLVAVFCANSRNGGHCDCVDSAILAAPCVTFFNALDLFIYERYWILVPN